MNEHENAVDRFTCVFETWITGEMNMHLKSHSATTQKVLEEIDKGNPVEAEELNQEASQHMGNSLELARIRTDVSSFMERIAERLRPYGMPPVEILFSKSELNPDVSTQSTSEVE